MTEIKTKTLAQLHDLTNRWAVITGGAGHVGFVAAQTLLELGANVILVDRSESGLEKAKQALKTAERVHTLVCDLSQRSDVDKAVLQIIEWTDNHLAVLINNAAFVGTDKLEGWAVPFDQQSIVTFEQCLTVNLTSPFQLCQGCAPSLTKFGQGDSSASIINVSSIYAHIGPRMEMYEGTAMGNPAAYGASKAGLELSTKWLASNLAPHVRANNIVLGGIFRGQPESFLNQYNKHNLMGRMAEEEDLKGAFALLASDASKYMTGQSIVIDGGWLAL
ncbi:SDR family oxidoreductase [Psychrosphaera ytuae]|uniref:SDR family oxidoreductase n=1 Tax=Psychrosphaera ytuae TaxID=2820710 RepID=A0A975HK07_9GAMM|nr:SDR family oxidoreductase [Psychrosphaera ytuae]QTH63809.1 SDR family oxidoreductase [Psychrosphaera ytuae]